MIQTEIYSDPLCSGFADTAFTEVHRPVHYGPGVPASLGFVLRFSTVRQMLPRLDPDPAQRGLDRPRDTLTAHRKADGVWFDSRAWIVTARNRRMD